MTVLSDRQGGDLAASYVAFREQPLMESLARALVAPLEPAMEAAFGAGDRPETWRGLTDPAVCRPSLIPYAGQWCGGTMPDRHPGETLEVYTARARVEVVYPRGLLKGCAQALRIRVQGTLSGTRTVIVRKNLDGHRWYVLVRVLPGEAGPLTDEAAHDLDVLPAGADVVLVVSDDRTIWELTGVIDDLPGTIENL